MNKPMIGNVYECTDARRPKRMRIIELRSTTAVCEVKVIGNHHYTRTTVIRRDRLNGKCHWKLVRRA